MSTLSAPEVLDMLKARGNTQLVITDRGISPAGVALNEFEQRCFDEHSEMILRWALASLVSKKVGFPVEVAWWASWFAGCSPGRRQGVYQVVPCSLVAPTPELSGFWSFVFDHKPRVYSTPLKAAVGFLEAFGRHQKLTGNRRRHAVKGAAR